MLSPTSALACWGGDSEESWTDTRSAVLRATAVDVPKI
jgi:hypothetical protein